MQIESHTLGFNLAKHGQQDGRLPNLGVVRVYCCEAGINGVGLLLEQNIRGNLEEYIGYDKTQHANMAYNRNGQDPRTKKMTKAILYLMPSMCNSLERSKTFAFAILTLEQQVSRQG